MPEQRATLAALRLLPIIGWLICAGTLANVAFGGFVDGALMFGLVSLPFGWLLFGVVLACLWVDARQASALAICSIGVFAAGLVEGAVSAYAMAPWEQQGMFLASALVSRIMMVLLNVVFIVIVVRALIGRASQPPPAVGNAAPNPDDLPANWRADEPLGAAWTRASDAAAGQEPTRRPPQGETEDRWGRA